MRHQLPLLESERSHPKPTVDALNRLWEEVSSRPLYARPHFWRYLRLRWRMRLKLLTASECSVVAPKWKTNDCTSCTDICCTGPHSTVTLGFHDIATLVDLGRAELISSHKPHFDPGVVQNRPALKRHLASTSWRQFPVLKQTSMGSCEALSLDGKCTLYPNWPLSCARFPYSLNLDDKKIFYSRRCDSFWIRHDRHQAVKGMALSAVVSYNQKIKDIVLLEYAPRQLRELGLLQHLSNPEAE